MLHLPPREARALVAGLIVLVALGAFVALRLRVSADISRLLPGGEVDADALLAKELTAGEPSRTLLLVVDAPDTETALSASVAFEAALRAEPRVGPALAFLEGGPPEGLEEALWRLYEPRRLAFLAPDAAQVPGLLSDDALRAAAAELKRRLALPISGLVSRVAPGDPLLVLPRLLERLAGTRAGELRVAGGRFLTPDGRGAVLFLGTQAAAFDPEAQRPLLAGVRAAFEQINARLGGVLHLSQAGVHRYSIRAEDRIARRRRARLDLVLPRDPAAAPAPLPLAAARAAHLPGRARGLAGGDGRLPGALRQRARPHAGLRRGAHRRDRRLPRALLLPPRARARPARAARHAERHLDRPGAGRAHDRGRLHRHDCLVLPRAARGGRVRRGGHRGLARRDARAAARARAGRRVPDARRPPARRGARARAGRAAGAARRGRAGHGGRRGRLGRAAAARALERRHRRAQPLRPRAELPRTTRSASASRATSSGAFVVAVGADEEAALAADDRVAAALAEAQAAGEVEGFRSLAALLPSAATQRAVDAAVRADPTLASRMDAALAEQGFVTEAFAPFGQALAQPPPEPLTWHDLADSPLAALVRPFRVTLPQGVGLLSFVSEVRDRPRSRRASPRCRARG
jgi:hypothetical protein